MPFLFQNSVVLPLNLMLTMHLKSLFSGLQLWPLATIRSITHCNSIKFRIMASGRIFQLKTDPLTGNSEWVVIEEENEAPELFSQTPLLANTSYLDMLNDSCRNKAFRQAIDKTIAKPCHVLDIGYCNYTTLYLHSCVFPPFRVLHQ